MSKLLTLLHVSIITLCIFDQSLKADNSSERSLIDPSAPLSQEQTIDLSVPPVMSDKIISKKKIEKKEITSQKKLKSSLHQKNNSNKAKNSLPISSSVVSRVKPHVIKQEKNMAETNIQPYSTPDWLRIDHARVIMPKSSTVLKADHPFTQALIKGYDTSSSLQAKLREYYSIAENLSQATAGWRPDISANAETGYAMTDEQTPIVQGIDPITNDPIIEPKGQSSINPQVLGITVTQNLFAGGETVALTKAAENQLKASRADFVSTVQNILLDTIKAYMDVWLQRERLHIIKTSENFYRQSLEQARAQAGVGDSSVTDVAQAEFSYQSAIANRKGIEGALKKAEAAYFNAINEEPSPYLPFPNTIDEVMEIPASVDILTKAVEKYNPTIIQADYSYEAAKNQTDVSTSNLIPSLDLVGSANRQLANKSRDNRENNASVTLRLSIPLYAKGGKDWSNVRQSEQKELQSKYTRNGQICDAIQQVKEFFDTYISSKFQITNYKNAVKAGEIRIDGTRQEYIVGERTLLEVLQAESDVTDIRNNLVQSKYDYVISGYSLLASVGELTPDVLQLNVQALDLDTYPQAVRNQLIGW